jgi:hypothetical protein
MTRTAIIGGYDGAGSALNPEEQAKIDLAVKESLRLPQHQKQILEGLGEIIAAERRIYEPSRTDDRERSSRLANLEQSSKSLLTALADLDDDTLSFLRWQPAFSWIVSIPQFEGLIADLKMTAEALGESATGILKRSSDQSRAENTDLAPRSFLIGLVLLYYQVVGEKPSYSKGSKFIQMMNAILDALQMPIVGEARLKRVIDYLVGNGELPSPPIKRGPKPHRAE